jgi:hypothetical protein
MVTSNYICTDGTVFPAFPQHLVRKVIVSPYYTQPLWGFLLTASRNTLQSYELSRLVHAANLRKELRALLDQYLEENTAVMLARWLMDQRERTVLGEETACASAPPENKGRRASDNLLGDRIVPLRASRGRA